jgi:REP element-mobilizing transposase RayT
MGFKYAIHHPNSMYFVTNTIVNWIDIFTKPPYADIIINSLSHCITAKGLQVHGWYIMPSHIHLLVSASLPTISLSDIMSDSKKFTSKKLLILLCKIIKVEKIGY